MKIKSYKFKKFTSYTGSLLPFTFDKKNFPMNVKRIFFIYGKKKFIRGDHAHKKCHQFFYPIFGSFEITIRSINKKKIFKINSKNNTGIHVPPLHWCQVKFTKKNSILLVFNSDKYQFKDYIENFEDFIKYKKK